MAKNRKVMITCAVTGAIHTPSMSPYLPVTPQEIIDAAVGAAEAGAALDQNGKSSTFLGVSSVSGTYAILLASSITGWPAQPKSSPSCGSVPSVA